MRRREGHVIVFSAAGLQRIVNAFLAYYMRWHALDPGEGLASPRPVRPPDDQRVVVLPDVNGLHDPYDRAA